MSHRLIGSGKLVVSPNKTRTACTIQHVRAVYHWYLGRRQWGIYIHNISLVWIRFFLGSKNPFFFVFFCLFVCLLLLLLFLAEVKPIQQWMKRDIHTSWRHVWVIHFIPVLLCVSMHGCSPHVMLFVAYTALCPHLIWHSWGRAPIPQSPGTVRNREEQQHSWTPCNDTVSLHAITQLDSM